MSPLDLSAALSGPIIQKGESHRYVLFHRALLVHAASLESCPSSLQSPGFGQKQKRTAPQHPSSLRTTAAVRLGAFVSASDICFL